MPKLQVPKFKSFFMAGYECTYALAENNRRFDLLAASAHDRLVTEDYELIKNEGIVTVREGLSWGGIDRGNNKYDFSRFEPMMRAAKNIGIQQIWDLNHFDFPEDINPFSEKFPKRFAEYAKRALEVIRNYQTGTLYICPVNEPSFSAWMCDVGLWAPYAKGRGTDFKKQLVRAGIAAMDAMWSLDKDVRFLHCDPYMYRRPQRVKNKDEKKFVENFNSNVRFHSWDMLSGRTNPELGGNPKYLNVLGVNYYFYNQQQVKVKKQGQKEVASFKSIALNSPLRLPLSEIIKEMGDRYHTPIILSETGSRGNLRLTWWPYILEEVRHCRKLGQPLYGMCAYPTLDILKGSGFIFPRSGLWDFDQKAKDYKRIPHEPTWKVLKKFIRQFAA